MTDKTRVFYHPETLFDHFHIAVDRPLLWPETDLVFGGEYIQFGSGMKHIRGFENWDWEEWDMEYGGPIPRKDGTFDGIVCYNTLDHISEPIRVLAEFQRIMKPGAWLVIVVPHFASELWHTDLTHKSQFGIDTWRNVFSERHYTHKGVVAGHVEWELEIIFNAIMGITERNTFLVTQFRKNDEEVK
jgi:SAM-dependent methyltransferase